MKVGIFTNNFAPIVSGVAISIANFRKGLRDLGHEVYVFAPKFKGHEDSSSHIYRYPSAPIKYKTKYPIPLPSRKALKFIKEREIDIIHSQHPWGVGTSALKAARKLDIPIIFTNHTMYGMYVDYLPKILPRRFLVGIVERTAIRYANKVDAVIAPTPSIREYLIKRGVKKPIHVVPSGIEHRELFDAPDADLRKQFEIPADHKIIMNVSRIGPEKNLVTLIVAFKEIVERYPKATLVMVGGGPFLETLKKLVSKLKLEKQVVFAGLVKPAVRGGYFREGDVFIHSSLSETQGLIMVESMIVGVPVVGIRANGVVDLVKDRVNGLITGGRPEELAEGVVKVLEDEALREKLSKGAVQTGKEYTVPAATKRLETAYTSILP